MKSEELESKLKLVKEKEESYKTVIELQSKGKKEPAVKKPVAKVKAKVKIAKPPPELEPEEQEEEQEEEHNPPPKKFNTKCTGQHQNNL